jgi:hypothetical protein
MTAKTNSGLVKMAIILTANILPLFFIWRCHFSTLENLEQVVAQVLAKSSTFTNYATLMWIGWGLLHFLSQERLILEKYY